MCLIALCMVTVMLTTNLQASQQPLTMVNTKTVFAHKKNEHVYWEALIQVANGNKEAALSIIEKFKDALPMTMPFSWQEKRPRTINAFFDKLFLDSVKYYPETLTFLGLFESIGIKEHNAQLTDISVERFVHSLEDAKKNLRLMNSYSYQDLSPDQKVSYETFSWLLNHEVAGEQFLFHNYSITQFSGILSGITIVLTQLHKIETMEDVEHYIARLTRIPYQIQQAAEFITLQEEKGILPPRFVVERVIDIIKKSTPEDIKENVFYAHLKQNLDKLNLEDKDALLEKVEMVIGRDVYAAYHMLENHFTMLLDKVQTNNGVWSLPDGDAYYAYMLQGQTTTDLSADEIYALGLQEVEKIHSEMRRILALENLNDPNKEVGALMQSLSENPQFYYPNTDDGRAKCVADFERIIERSRKELAHLFGLKPQIGVKMQRVPMHEEQCSPGAYYLPPSIDGSRAGVFYVNLRDMAEVPTYGMETLTIHEAEPRHHFQLALQSVVNIPILRKLGEYTAHAEGWALYAEKLAYEYGFYSSSFAQIGHLQDELMRAVRLVVDTGIHHKRWTREQAIDYMQKATGYHYKTVVSEVERYFVLPGQACAYKIGQLKILELRQRARKTLGDQFDIREFHDVILRTAAVPLTILEQVIDTYIENKLTP